MVKIPDSEWKTKLTPEQYSVCREKGTEPVGSNMKKKIKNDIWCQGAGGREGVVQWYTPFIVA